MRHTTHRSLSSHIYLVAPFLELASPGNPTMSNRETRRQGGLSRFLRCATSKAYVLRIRRRSTFASQNQSTLIRKSATGSLTGPCAQAYQYHRIWTETCVARRPEYSKVSPSTWVPSNYISVVFTPYLEGLTAKAVVHCHGRKESFGSREFGPPSA